MSTTTTNYGLIKPDTTDPILVGQLNDNADVIDATLKSLSDALDVAKLGIKYKGEVNYYSNLPSSGNQIGDAYTVKYAGSSGTTPDGTEYVWGTVSGTNQWINFSKDSYTKAEVDALLSLKANIADIPTPSTAAPAMDGTAAAGTSTDYARADHVHPSDTSKQDALTTAQLDAVNSGIDSTKVAQIETNKNNISMANAELIELVDSGAKNKIFVDKLNTTNANGVTYTINNDGTITANGTPSGTSSSYVVVALPDGSTYKNFAEYCNGDNVLSGCPSGGGNGRYRMYITGKGYAREDFGNGVKLTDTSVTPVYLIIYIYNGYTANNLKFKPMICTKAAWDISQTYQPYRPSYQELYEMVKTLQAQLANQ